MVTTPNARAQRRKIENRRDRLSGLPDHLLVSIISLLPFKNAITTDVLSKRWRGLWTHHSVIDLSIYERHNEFFNSIDNLLPKLTSPIIDRFSLILDHTKTFCKGKRRNYTRIPSWFDWAFSHGNKQVLKFKFNINDEVSKLRAKYLVTPLCVFELELRPWLFLQSNYNDDNSSFNLLNLKKVSIQLHSLNTKLLEKLVSNSPSLEDLYFELCLVKNKYFGLNLASTSLKRLDMNLNYPIEIVLNTPSLKDLTIDLNSRDELHYQISFVNAPTALLTCSFWAFSDGLPDFELMQPSAFYSAISNVVSLTVIDKSPGPLLAATTFRNLTRLTLVVYFSDNALFPGLALLHQCPMLEVLTFDMTECYRIRRSAWLLPDSAPHCLISCLKRIEIFVPSFRRLAAESLLHLLKYLLGSATALKRLKINIIRPRLRHRCEKIVRDYDEPKLIKEVLEVPRSSPQ